MRQPKLHKWADKCTEILIYFIVLFSPWAFGTTEHWSIWTMNITAYALGALLVSKWIIRWPTGFRPWPSEAPKNETSPRQHRLRLIEKNCTALSAVFMILLLGYILTSAINARASFNLETHEYTYFEGINKSLPHSYDAKGTWFLFWQYLGLIVLFWSTRDWLAGARPYRSSISLNPRLRRLLFLICFNCGALAMESILQRLYYGDSLGKLIFLVEPSIGHQNNFQFGPFAYRSNASTYLNLIWPIGLGLVIQLGRENLEYYKKKIGSGAELLLIPCIIVTASGPIISSSRGGALVMIGLVILVAILLSQLKSSSNFIPITVSMCLIVGLGIGYYFGWEKIRSRFIYALTDNMSDRTVIYEKSFKLIDSYVMSKHHPSPFGSGPGTFETIIQFELEDDIDGWSEGKINEGGISDGSTIEYNVFRYDVYDSIGINVHKTIGSLIPDNRYLLSVKYLIPDSKSTGGANSHVDGFRFGLNSSDDVLGLKIIGAWTTATYEFIASSPIDELRLYPTAGDLMELSGLENK